MACDTLNLRLVSPHLGAEVRGLDITRPLTNRQVAELHQALGEFGVLLFRDQRFDFDSQKRFGRYFGGLDIHPNTPGPDGHPEILPIHADENSKMIAGEKWHSDVSCRHPPQRHQPRLARQRQHRAPGGRDAEVAQRRGVDARALPGRRILALPAVAAQLEGQGVEPVAGTPEALAARLAEDVPRWPAIVRAAGARLD